MSTEAAQALGYVYKGATHLMLGVIAWFVIGTYNRIDKIEQVGQSNSSAIVELRSDIRHHTTEINQNKQQIDNLFNRTTTLHAPGNRRN